MKLILLNGPPRSGKDFAAARILTQLYRESGAALFHDKFSAPIKQAFSAITNTYLTSDFVNQEWEHRKDEIIPTFGVSYRQWQIDFSERFMKRLYGDNIFGRLFLDRDSHREDARIVVVSDCGFNVEVDTIIEAYDPADILLIRLYRSGTSFAGDSREYVDAGFHRPDGRRFNFAPLVNCGTPAFTSRLEAAVRPFLRGLSC